MQIKATKEAVFTTADVLAAAGKPVSIDAVVDVVGGSKSTVSPLLADWRAEEERRRSVVVGGELPERVENLALALARQAWATAIEEAHERFAGQRAAHAAAAETLKREAERLCDRISELEGEVGDVTARLFAAELEAKRARALERSLERTKADLERANAAVDKAIADERLQRERAAVAEARVAYVDAAAAKVRGEKAAAKSSKAGPQEPVEAGLPLDTPVAQDVNAVDA